MQKTGRSSSCFSLEERRRIVAEYRSGNQSARVICQKYGIKSISLINLWEKRHCQSLSVSEKALPLLMKSSHQQIMDNESKDEYLFRLESEVKILRKQLEQSELKNKALNTLIDIAEEQGLKIRKNSGAKR